jgi:2-polyprenyl-3-methyl-5-hydroxy-6-metoxy-1,4-benzoquinol methylase
MISIEQHKELIKKWAKVQEGAGTYQKLTRRHRLEFFMNHVDKFKGMDVFEIGCNAGLYGYEISQVANSYTGIDKGDYYILQSAITKEYMKNPNVTFYNENVKSFIKRDLLGEAPKYNALFASFVLYHLSEKETDRLAETVLPKCDLVIISTRTKKRTPWKKYNPNKFNNPENVKTYLEAAGFKCEIVWPKGTVVTQKKQKYAYIIATRPTEEKTNKKKTVKRDTKVSTRPAKTVKAPVV